MLAPRSWLRQAGACVYAVTSIVVTFAQQAPAPPPPGVAAPPTPIAAVLRSYQPVTAERLKNPERRQLADDSPHLRRLGLQSADADHARQRQAAAAGLGILPTGEAKVHEAAAGRQQRRDVRLDAEQPGDRHRREERRTCSGATGGRVRTGAIVLHDTNRGVALYGDKVFFAAGEAVLVALDATTGREVWSTSVADNTVALLHLARAARRRREGDGRRLRRRIRHSRLRGGVRSGHRQGTVAHLHGSRARRTRERDVAEGRSMEDGRRAGLGHRQLRSGDQPRVLGNRQRRPVDGRPASGRQPLRRIDDRDRCRDRPDQGPLPIQPERIVGLGRGVAADPGRLPAQRPHHQRPDRRGARRLSLVSRAQQRADQVRRRQAVRETERVPRVSTR